jgi:hypothetical protein
MKINELLENNVVDIRDRLARNRAKEYDSQIQQTKIKREQLTNWLHNEIEKIEKNTEGKIKNLDEILYRRLKSLHQDNVLYLDILEVINDDESHEYHKNVQKFIKDNLDTIQQIIFSQFLELLKLGKTSNDQPWGINWPKITGFNYTVENVRNFLKYFRSIKL